MPHTVETKNEQYNLLLAFYHALQGTERYIRYVQDAEQAGDSELARFFREMQEEERRRVERAKKLLAERNWLTWTPSLV